ncbi:MAG TPA: hypothetical protein VJY62_07815, partial [Bacteroidia bacterium]|nr:hypothetical protein [Bacteroidia bacterium]
MKIKINNPESKKENFPKIKKLTKMSSKSVFFENLKKNKRIIAGSLLIIVVSWVLITALRSPNENEKIDKANEFLTNQTSEEQLEILKKFKDRKTQTFDYGLFNKIIIEKNELFDINLKKLFYYSNFKLDSYDNDTILIHLENGKSIIKRFNTERWDSSGLELSNYSSLDEIEKFYKFANSLVIVTNISNENINENNNFIDFSLIERGERYNSVKETKHNKYYGMHLIQNNSEIKSDTVSITYLNYCDYESVLKVDSNIVFIGYSLEKAQIFLIPINSENFKKDLIEVEIPKGIKIVDVTGNLILALNEMDTCIYTCKLKKNENNIFEIQIGNKFLNKGAFDLDNFSNCSFFSHDNINYVYNFNTVKIALIKNGSVYKDSIDVGNNYILSKSYKAKLIFKKDYKTDEDIEFKLFSFSENSIDTSIYRFDPYFARSKAIVTSIGGHLYVTFMSTIV